MAHSSPVEASQQGHAGNQARFSIWVFFSYFVILVIALFFRTCDLGQFITVDESDFWIQRSVTWLHAIQELRWADTAISPHPGVTTMWLGVGGLFLRDNLSRLGWLTDPSFQSQLALLQLPVGFVNGLAVLFGYELLRRLYGCWSAFLAAIFWATDPFTIAFQRVLHTDGLAATGVTISILAACLYWYRDRRLMWLMISGSAAAWAVLSKSTGLVAVPIVGLIAISAVYVSRSPTSDRLRLVRPMLVWVGAAVLTSLVLWPALWADPVRTLNLLRVGIDAEGARPHELGNFFLGREDLAPGVLFYPVALVLRSTPWVLIGICMLPWGLRRMSIPQQRVVALLALTVIVFVLCLSPFPKKFNRYLVPVSPMVAILAAIGIAQVSARLWDSAALRPYTRPYQRLAPALGVAMLTLLSVATIQSWHPYAIAYFNPLFGGAQAGADTFQIGWGEGMEQAASWLNQQPDITGVLIASTRKSTLQPYLVHGAQAIEPPGAEQFPVHTGYAVIYVRDAQVRPWSPFDSLLQQMPLHTVMIHGVAYAWIYQVPPPVEHALPVVFGDLVKLRGYTLNRSVSNEASITLFWEPQHNPNHDLAVFLHVLDPHGVRVAQVDIPISSTVLQPGMYPQTQIPLANVDTQIECCYSYLIGVYNPADGARLPIPADVAADPSLTGAYALLLPVQ